MLKLTVASGHIGLWQRAKGKQKMRERAIIPATRPERNGMRTVVGNFRDYGFCFFQLLHPANVVELENPGTWVFYRPVFGKRCFLYLKYLKYKILLIAHKNILSKRIWGVKNLTGCLKTFIGGLKKPCRAIISEK